MLSEILPSEKRFARLNEPQRHRVL